jgi:hypothetical protein
MNRYIWSAVGVVCLAYVLMAVVKELLPFVIIAVIASLIFRILFRRRV